MHRHGVVPRTGNTSAFTERVADTVRRDSALVIHRQVQPVDPFGAANCLYFVELKVTSAFDGNNQFGKEVDADDEKSDDKPPRELFQSFLIFRNPRTLFSGQSLLEL